jgi:hypothetical protein
MRYDPGGHAGHGSHAAVPVVVLYVPATHASQLPAAPGTHPMRLWPGGQTPQNSHNPGEGPPHPFRTCPVEQASQLVQSDAPVASEYVPVKQSTHVKPDSEYVPARQFKQSAKASDPDGDDFPGAQFKHVVAATVVEYLPAVQSVQTEAPATEYLPASHWLQDEAPSMSEKVPAGHAVHSSSKGKGSMQMQHMSGGIPFS